MSVDFVPEQTAVLAHRHHNILQAIYVLIDDADRRTMGGFGLNLSQYRVLDLLDIEDGQRLTTLSQRLLLAKSTITRIIDQLESDGLVRRGIDADDRRAQRVCLTDSGAALLVRAREVYKEGIESRLGGIFSPEEQERFTALLLKLHDSLVEDLYPEEARARRAEG